MATYKNGSSGSTTSSSSSTNSHSVTNSTSVTGYTGQVSANTQANLAKYQKDYEEGEKVVNAYNQLQQTIANKPKDFQSSYTDQLNNLYDQIMNREQFKYDMNADALYQQYKGQYERQGQKAMRDTMAQAAALTGGYASSYGQTAGQQAYQSYLEELNNKVPELYQMAYQKYKDEGEDINNKYNITNSAYNREYGEYRDTVSDWQSDRSFYQSQYQDERNFDYGKFSDNRNYWTDEYWNERKAETTTNSTSTTDTSSTTDSTSSTSSWDNSTTWSDDPVKTKSSGGSGDGSGKSDSGDHTYYDYLLAGENNAAGKAFTEGRNGVPSSAIADAKREAGEYARSKGLEYEIAKKNKWGII